MQGCFFIFAQALTHIGLILVAGLTTEGVMLALPTWREQGLKIGITVWCATLLLALLANQFYYPYSAFSTLTATIFYQPILLKTALFILLFFLSLCWLLAIKGYMQIFYAKLSRTHFIVFSLLSLSSYGAYHYQAYPVIDTNLRPDLPNIFVIGFDSLRPDVLNQANRHQTAPTLSAFLEQSVQFQNTITPLARTFPSWASILTGQYPKETGIRTNLQDLQNQNFNASLPSILKNLGYRTFFATDETRFSNLDQGFGFQELITPPIGINDFLLGTINDFPLSNLLINTRIGRFFFPNSYANRAVFHTYNPDTFLQLIRPALFSPNSQPVFGAIHFCLPHYPYLYADLPENIAKPRDRYLQTISRVDLQFKQLMQLLKEAGLLQNAIVIVLSDHGEAMELPGDRATDVSLYQPQQKNHAIQGFKTPTPRLAINTSAGHGTDVLSLSQYRTLLAFKQYGDSTTWQPHQVAGHASLLDIKPTLLSLLALPDTKMSGLSLTPYLTQQKTHIEVKRPLFMESDYSPDAIRSIYPNIPEAIADGLDLFQVDTISNKLILRKDRFNMVMKSKQYAILYDHWMLALYPSSDQGYHSILLDLKTGRWTNQLHTPFANHAPLSLLTQKLKHFYGLV